MPPSSRSGVNPKNSSCIRFYFPSSSLPPLQIAHALENLCEGLPWLFEVCWRLVEACMDDIIEMLIRDGLNPSDMCAALYLCP